MNQTGNLEKLGILVIVILVVVVGVVALTPTNRANEALYGSADGTAPPQPLEPLASGADQTDPHAWPLADGPYDLPPTDAPVAKGANDALPPGGASTTVPPTDATVPGGPTGLQPVQPPLGTNLTPAPASAPAMREYTIRKGDTPASIAKAHLGRASAAQAILDANPGLDARRLKIGQKIFLPGTTTPSPTASAPASTGTETTTGPSPVVIDVPPAPATTSAKQYTVQPGDTLSDIARRELGSASKWRQILDANSSVLHGSEVVRSGMKLTIPGRTSTTASSGTTASAPAPSTRTAPAVGGTTYKVQSGDTLTSIASRTLGSGARWRELLSANDSVLHGSDRLKVGMELTIPQDVSAR